jgi:hypothetical protein
METAKQTNYMTAAQIISEILAWSSGDFYNTLYTERENILIAVESKGGHAGWVANTCLKFGRADRRDAEIIASAYLA